MLLEKKVLKEDGSIDLDKSILHNKAQGITAALQNAGITALSMTTLYPFSKVFTQSQNEHMLAFSAVACSLSALYGYWLGGLNYLHVKEAQAATSAATTNTTSETKEAQAATGKPVAAVAAATKEIPEHLRYKEDRGDDNHHSGIEYLENEREAIKRIASIESPQIKKETKPGLFIGGCQLSRRRETGHIIVNGLPGGGKTVLAKSILKQIIDNDDRAIIHDSKGDYTAFLPIESFALFAPWDDRTVWWDLSKDITNPQLAQTFAANLFNDGAKGDPFWNNAARDLFAGVLTYFMRVKKDSWGWVDIADAIAGGGDDFIRMANLGDPNTRMLAEPEPGKKDKNKTTLSMLQTVSSKVGWIGVYAYSTDFAPEKAFSITKWLSKKDDRKILILQNNSNYKSRAEQIFGNFLQAMSAYANSSSMPEISESEQGIYMLLDEFPQLGKNVGEVSQTLMELGRSRGIRMIFMVQDLSQLEQVLGKDRGDVMRSLQQTRIWCKSSAEAAKKSSDLFGNKEIWSKSYSRQDNGNGSNSKSIQRVPVITPDAFTGLEVLSSGAEIILSIDDALVKTVVPFTDMPDIRAKVVESESWKNGLLIMAEKFDAQNKPEPEKEEEKASDFWKNIKVDDLEPAPTVEPVQQVQQTQQAQQQASNSMGVFGALAMGVLAADLLATNEHNPNDYDFSDSVDDNGDN